MTFFIALLALWIFLLYEVRLQCRCVLSNLATGYTWYAGGLSMFIANQTGGVIAERTDIGTERF